MNISMLDYPMGHHEELNSYKVVDLLINESRTSVVDALRGIAKSMEAILHDDPCNIHIQDYACTIAWHYTRLRDCDEIDVLLERVSKIKAAENNCAEVVSEINKQIDLLVREILDLGKFMNQRHFVPYVRRDANIQDGLHTHIEYAQFFHGRVFDVSELLGWCNGVISMLRRAPWTLKDVREIFYADPARRIDFEYACRALQPKISELMDLANKYIALTKEANEFYEARRKVEEKWIQAREGRLIPVLLGDAVKKFIDEQRV